MKARRFFAFVAGAAMLFSGVGCTPEEGADSNPASIVVSPSSISVDYAGKTETVQVVSNATWVATCDVEGVKITPFAGNGDATVSIEIPAATQDRTFTVNFLATKSITVAGIVAPSTNEAKVTVSQNASGTNLSDYVYYEDCGTNVEKDGSYWPYVDKFVGWNPQGASATAVSYSGNNASVRASGGNYQPTEDALGVSGQPYVFLNKVPASANFVINDIAVKGGAQYIFTFNVSCQNSYENSLPGFAEVTNELVHLELGYDGTNYAAVNFTATPNGGNGWHATVTEFKTKADATKLYARFTYEAPASNGGGRFDDFKLVEGGNGAELEVTTSTPTPDPTPTDAIYAESFTNGQGEFTINDVVLTGELTYVWKHESGDYGTYMKASGYKGSATASESWLISPAISLVGTTKPAVSFDHCHKFAGTPSEELTLWVSENDGADWTQLAISTYGSNSDYSFVTNTTDLTAYVGKTIKVAFKYVSTTANAATWEVKNVKVAEGTATETPVVPEGDAVSLTFSELGYANAAELEGLTIAIDDNTSCEFFKNSGSTSPKYYNTGNAARLYGQNTLVISSTKTIKYVKFTVNAGQKEAELAAEGYDAATYTWVGESKSVTFTQSGTTGHTRIQKIELIYAE